MSYINSKTYKIQSGDTLSEIAKKYGFGVQELAQYNGIKDPNKIFAGKNLYIPVRGDPNWKPQPEYKPYIPPASADAIESPVLSPLDLIGPGLLKLGGKAAGALMKPAATLPRVEPDLGLAGLFNSAIRQHPSRAFNPDVVQRGINRFAGQSRRPPDISKLSGTNYTGQQRTMNDLYNMLYGAK